MIDELEALKQQRMSDIIDELEALSFKTNTLTHELKQLRQQGTQTRRRGPNGMARNHSFKKGDRVVIKNMYLGRKGTEGTVSYTTKTQITLLDDSGKLHTRKFTNIGRVN
jgi:hypothetical protein